MVKAFDALWKAASNLRQVLLINKYYVFYLIFFKYILGLGDAIFLQVTIWFDEPSKSILGWSRYKGALGNHVDSHTASASQYALQKFN